MDPNTQNRRQRVDAAEHNLDQALQAQASAEKRKLRAMQEMTDSDARLTEAFAVTNAARANLAQAYAYQDPAPAGRTQPDQGELDVASGTTPAQHHDMAALHGDAESAVPASGLFNPLTDMQRAAAG